MNSFRTNSPHSMLLQRNFFFFLWSLQKKIKVLTKKTYCFGQVCLGRVGDTNIDAFVTGFGTSGSIDWNTMAVACWTDQYGPAMFTQWVHKLFMIHITTSLFLICLHKFVFLWWRYSLCILIDSYFDSNLLDM